METSGARQWVSSISCPSGVNQPMSLTPEPWMAWPWKNLRRRNTGWSRRSAITDLVNSISASWSSSSSQSTQEISLSWQ